MRKPTKAAYYWCRASPEDDWDMAQITFRKGTGRIRMMDSADWKNLNLMEGGYEFVRIKKPLEV